MSEVVEMKEVMGGGGVVANRIQALRCFGIAPRKSRTRAGPTVIMSAPLDYFSSPSSVFLDSIHMLRY